MWGAPVSVVAIAFKRTSTRRETSTRRAATESRFAAFGVRPALFHTQGGLLGGEKARVRNAGRSADSRTLRIRSCGPRPRSREIPRGNTLLPVLGLHLEADHVALGQAAR